MEAGREQSQDPLEVRPVRPALERTGGRQRPVAACHIDRGKDRGQVMLGHSVHDLQNIT